MSRLCLFSAQQGAARLSSRLTRKAAPVAALIAVWYSTAALANTGIQSVFVDEESRRIYIDGDEFLRKTLIPSVQLEGQSLEVDSIHTTDSHIEAALPNGLQLVPGNGYQLVVLRNCGRRTCGTASDADIATFSIFVSAAGGGTTGATGPAGPAGPAGPTGPMGPAGIGMGMPGPMGPSGAAGSNGAMGPMGPMGSIGPAGPQGDPGSTGDAGPTGPTGPAGTFAAAFRGIWNGEDSYNAGDVVTNAGSSWLCGADGCAGEPVADNANWSVVAQAGAIGETGPAGARGDAGSPGAAGAASTVPGPIGPPGPKGDAGTPGAKGDAGAPGAKGDTGPQGLPGSSGASVLTAMTVQSVLAESPAGASAGAQVGAGAVCPAGQIAIGGGGILGYTVPVGIPQPHGSAALTQSMPNANLSSWIAGATVVVNLGPTTKLWFRTYAVCAPGVAITSAE